ncbi:MAG: TRAP transporter TatT component family protein [Spirochaetales bacterium]
MKKALYASVCIISMMLLASCQTMVMNAVSDSLSGANKNGVAPKKVADNDMMTVLTGEEDPVLMAGFFPTALKLYDIMLAQNPEHQGLATMTGSLYVMYANVFVQANADMLDVTDYILQQSELQRAKLHYLRGRTYGFQAFDGRYPGFSDALLSGDEDRIATALEQLTTDDVNAAYWLGAGWLGAFSVDPLDTSLLRTTGGAVALLEKAAALDPDYSDGAIWDILTAFYASTGDFGGDMERAYFTSEESFRVSGGKSPSPYVTYATAFCVPQEDIDGFVEYLNAALAINPDDNPSTRLATIITQQKAAWLLENIDDYFIVW